MHQKARERSGQARVVFAVWFLVRSWCSARAAYPQRRSSNANSLQSQIRLDSRKSVRSFKAIICVDISEFESCVPSHAVWSPPANFQQCLYSVFRPTRRPLPTGTVASVWGLPEGTPMRPPRPRVWPRRTGLGAGGNSNHRGATFRRERYGLAPDRGPPALARFPKFEELVCYRLPANCKRSDTGPSGINCPLFKPSGTFGQLPN